jgi:Flp pilus assembly pilin Flp
MLYGMTQRGKKNERGVTATDYAILVALIGLALIAALTQIEGVLTDKYVGFFPECNDAAPRKQEACIPKD